MAGDDDVTFCVQTIWAAPSMGPPSAPLFLPNSRPHTRWDAPHERQQSQNKNNHLSTPACTSANMKRSAGWNQEVTDEDGRRRFHGAFTGGFSAGYFNSVGTKEGWQPSSFSSSRQERGRVQQRAEDFMDEDDDPLLGKRLEITAQYDTLQSRARQQQKLAVEDKPRNAFEAQVLGMTQRAAVSAYPTMNFLDDLVRPVNDSIGAKLLNQMGWKEGHGIGPRIRKKRISGDTKQASRKGLASSARHEADDHAAEEEVVYIPPRNTIDAAAFPKPKLDKYGVGFDPFVDAPEFSRYKQHQENELAQKQQKRQVVTFADAMKATSGSYETVTAFGLSALEDNDDLDVYGTAAMSEFDTAIGPARLTNGKEIKRIDSEARESLSHGERKDRAPAFGTDGRPALPGFELACVKEKPPKAVALRLEVPSDFKPFHRFKDDDENKRDGETDPAAALYRKHNFTTGKYGQGSLMTAKQRAALLGEPQQIVQKAPDAESLHGGAPGSGSVFDLLGAEQKARIFAAVAQARLSSASNPGADVAPPSHAPKEREPLKQDDDSEEILPHGEHVDSKLAALQTVPCEVSRWESSVRDASANEEKRDLFDKELVPHLVEFAAERRVNQGAAAPDGTTGTASNAQSVPSRPANRNRGQETKSDDEELPPLPIVEKPAASLLKSIFEPSDESDVDEHTEDDASDDDDDDEDDDENEPRAAPDRAIGLRDARVSIDQKSVTASKTDQNSAVVLGNDTKREEQVPRGEKDGAGISSNDGSSSSSDSEGDSERDTKKRKKSSSAKKKHKHKKKKHHRSSRRDEDSDDGEVNDRKHRKKRKESKRSASSRKKKPSRKRSRSASRDRSETRSSSSKHHRRQQ